MRCPSRLQMRTRSSVAIGRLSSASSSGERGGDLLAVADGDDHQRDVGVGGEEPCPLPGSVGGAVDAEQHGGAGDAVAVQHVDDRFVGRA
jgi:hypothetical protein